MMKNCSIAIWLMFVLVACRNEGFQVNIQTNGKIVVIDSVNISNNYNDEYENFLPIFYWGKIKDSICLRKNWLKSSEPIIFITRELNFQMADSLNTKIVVDTVFNFSTRVPYQHLTDSFYLSVLDSITFYKSFLVFVYNLSDKLIMVSDYKNSVLNYERLALNEQGNWVNIEKPTSLPCGAGIQQIGLFAKHMFVGKIFRHNGNFKTKCRLKFKIGNNIIYSNIFEDWIDKRMFTIDFDSNYME